LFFYSKQFSKKFKKIFKKLLTNVKKGAIMVSPNQERRAKMLYMTVKQIAQRAGVSPQRVYYIKNRLGHLPTVAEVKNYKPKKAGRPPKLILKDGEINVEI
jgi:predicted phosphatase